MKNLANLNGAKALSKNEQKSINGGKDRVCCNPAINCCVTNGPGPCTYRFSVYPFCI